LEETFGDDSPAYVHDDSRRGLRSPGAIAALRSVRSLLFVAASVRELRIAFISMSSRDQGRPDFL